MNTEQLRAEFEAHFSKPPFEWEFHRYGEDSAWPGNYQLYEHQCAWEAYQAGRAALQSREREVIEEGFRWRSINPPYKIWNYVWGRSPDSWKLREAEIQNVVVYARRVEGYEK